jgi:hypothetical protein
MAYAERVRTYGTTQYSTPSINRKTCVIGTNSFTY